MKRDVYESHIETWFDWINFIFIFEQFDTEDTHLLCCWPTISNLPVLNFKFTAWLLCFGGYDKLQDNLVKLKSPKLLYKFRRLEMKQNSGKIWNSGKMQWPIFAAMILHCSVRSPCIIEAIHWSYPLHIAEIELLWKFWVSTCSIGKDILIFSSVTLLLQCIYETFGRKKNHSFLAVRCRMLFLRLAQKQPSNRSKFEFVYFHQSLALDHQTLHRGKH